MKAYKVFNSDWTCRGFKFKVGKTYDLGTNPIMCERGFHACLKVQDCFNYYCFDPENKVAEVELRGIVLGEKDKKQCAEKITIIKELSWNEMLILANTGLGCSGHSNSGHSNSGHRNSGHRNSGHRNSGDSNSGHSNSGHRNSGDRNSGDRNSGHRNSGDSNSGDWNSGDWNSGFFNSIKPDTIFVFNKLCDRFKWESAEKPNFIRNLILNTWVYFFDMTDDEKKENPKAYVCDGYLKTFNYKHAWKVAFVSANEEDIKLLKSLPNFDSSVFEEITGLKL